MSTRLGWIAAAAVAAGVAACASGAPAVPVTAGPEGTASLAGSWRGEYHSPETGRSGSIVFHLDAGRDTAEGDVVMIPRGAGGPVQRVLVPGEPVRTPGQSQSLTIRFVRLEGNQVSGALDPYREPACNCTAYTTFTGTLSGNRISGAFITRARGGPTSGTWTADRVGP